MRALRLILLAAMATSSLSLAETPPQQVTPPSRPAPRAYAAALGNFIEQLRATPAAPPGTVVIVTHRGRTLFERAYGVRNIETGDPLTLDTPIYNASVTKAYTGLLAAMFDAEGVLPIDAPITETWRGLRLPPGIDARGVTIGALLSHSAPLNADGLVYRTVVSGEGTGVADVRNYLETQALPREPTFEYSNAGPVIWAAMMEARTGIHWREMLQRRILQPLAMRRSSARTEDFRPGQIARCHPRSAGAWRSTPPKPTAVMNAAGGMFTSGRDAARFIQLFATEGASERGKISPVLLRRTWQKQSPQDRDIFGTHRDGYGLGWDLGTVLGQRFVSRSGGYAGCRSMALFLPENGLGVVVLTNGDVGANSHNAAIFHQAIDLWTGGAGATARGATRISEYQTAALAEVARADKGSPGLAEVRRLDPAAWRGAEGRYANDRLGSVDVKLEAGELRIQLGVSSGRLLWVGGDAFLAIVDPDPAPEAFRFERAADGKVNALVFDNDRFTRRG
jgi:CubicO group peptidase (beta-lactamase class C family)